MTKKYKLNIFQSLNAIKHFDWDACNNSSNLFTSYNFLKLIEDSNSLSERTGWYPYYFCWSKNNKILACVAAYKKLNSQGEFVFDHSWANVYQRLGLNYYPKLVIASPFTPITGKRILVKDENDVELKNNIINDLKRFCLENDFSGIHINFIDENEKKFFLKNNFIVRYGEQFHFKNNNYKNFEDFLNDLSYKKRKAIKRERASVIKMGIKVKVLTGDEIDKSILAELYNLYILTINKKWSYDYLTKDFFLNLKSYLNRNLVIIVAVEKSSIISVALNFISNNTLYGRYWGTKKELPFLHFEVCYYKAVETAIKLKLDKVEAGAQGPHKIKRGYIPRLTYSAHILFNEELHKIFSKYNKLEQKNIIDDINVIKEQYSPFKTTS